MRYEATKLIPAFLMVLACVQGASFGTPDKPVSQFTGRGKDERMASLRLKSHSRQTAERSPGLSPSTFRCSGRTGSGTWRAKPFGSR
jgi:hypothetical protein